jgi:hypothetical protein
MRLRFPSFAELLGLFLSPKSVDAAVSSISRAIKHLHDVAAHHDLHAAAKIAVAEDLNAQAEALIGQSYDHQDEAAKACRVAVNLAALVA